MANEITDGIATPEELRERDLEGLARELDGAKRRVQELKDANAHQDVIAQADEAVGNARSALESLGAGQKSASKRPRTGGKRETR
jgi:hypothetical protein